MVEEEIVIVGAGICGLATALALHRKGIRSVVLERAESLRASGAAIGILANGWCALHQLGLDSLLRQLSLPVYGAREICLDKGINKEANLGIGEARCLRRRDLINALADALPPGTIRFSHQIMSIKLHAQSSFPVLKMLDDTSVVAKALIGCDGAKSVVAEFLELPPAREFSSVSARSGLTNYPNGHAFIQEFARIKKNNILVGVVPVNENTMHWLVVQQSIHKGAESSTVPLEPEKILESILELVKHFPIELVEMIKGCELESITLGRVRYRPPSDLLLRKFRKGTVTIAGDALHVMGPYIGQGGSAALEDAIILARCFSRKIPKTFDLDGRKLMAQSVGEAMDEYWRERRTRIVRLSLQTYLIGLIALPSTPMLVRLSCIVLMVILFPNPNSHSMYNCGTL